MISFENTEVFNFNGAIRGMRNPLNSWDKSDSYIKQNCNECQHKSDYSVCKHNPTHKCFNVVIGENDLALMKKLIKAGSDHRKFMRQIFVCVDITAPLYWWKEFDTYKVGTVSNSCSTMHKIHDKEFELNDFSVEHLSPQSLNLLQDVIIMLNQYRAYYNAKDDKKIDMHTEMSNECYAKYKKELWWQMIQLLPSSYNQRRTITLTYETIYNMRKARRNHKLDEWRVGFMDWSDYLPYAAELFD